MRYASAHDNRRALEFLAGLPAGDYPLDVLTNDLSVMVGDAADLALQWALKGGYIAIVKTPDSGPIMRVDPAWVQRMVSVASGGL